MRRTALPAFSVVVLCAALAACGDDEPSDSAPQDTGASGDTGSGDIGTIDVGDDADDDAEDDADDTEDDAGVDVEDEPVRRSGYGEPCQEDLDCTGFLCLRLESGTESGICAGYCNSEDDCPADGWDCVFLANSGTDATLICVPEDLCIDVDEDGYGSGPGCLAPDCDDGDPAINPGADELCDDVDNDCDGNIDDNPVDANQDCDSGFPGACEAGRTFCDAGLLTCTSLRAPAEEICDGLDNDCDGLVDEEDDGEPISDRCYAGPLGTVYVGECVPGRRTCEDGGFTSCVGQVLPDLEQCNGLDDDCDGEIDEGNPGEGAVCDTGLDGLCGQGLASCTDEGLLCVPRFEPQAEICDGFDNDCDGLIDEDDDGETLTRSCFDGEEFELGVGECRAGVQTCVDGDFGRCVGQVLATIEICDELDNDCDGVVNNGNPAGGFLCETGLLGLCAFGRSECGETDPECIPDFEPSPEICDGFDNDCDGLIDEDLDGGPLTRGCYDGEDGTEGIGVCTGGVQTCNFGDWGGCVGQRLPSVEVCDGADNDCDGTRDDGNPGGGISCTTGEPGICNPGATACVEGRAVCVADEVAGVELCDGLDNDCNGTPDDAPAFDGLGEICLAGQGICQVAGVRVCDPDNPSGPPVCGATPRPAGVEVCDGLDNDCDGGVDEDPAWAGRGAVCFSGQGACRSAGVLVCDPDNSSGPLVCSATEGVASDEVCDGIDNDCDGQVDEGAWSTLGDVCFSGQGACRAAGVFVCNPDDPAGPPVCSADEGTSSPEVCDGIDNDCDGEVDEGALWASVGEVCTAGRGACQATGILACNPANRGGPAICDADVGSPTTEVCDNIDNNCNGQVDEGALWADKGDGCVAGVGECRAAGVLVCDTANPSGALTCSGEPRTPRTDICDGLDNNCDGTPDEEFTSLGQSCFAGDGLCRTAGVIVCTGDVTTGCSAVPADPPTANETVCDYIDDDCDGQVDEDFRTGALYATAEHCGGCGVACEDLWAGGSAAFDVVPFCATSMLTASCSYTCASGAFDLDGDPSNGCEFRPEADTVYVSADDGADDGSCGAYDSPCASISYALSPRAGLLGATRVRVAAGEYEENITVAAGVDLLGGHNALNWTRRPALYPSIITGTEGLLDNVAVTAADIGTGSPTEISGFTINAANGASGGGNSIGVLLVDAPGVTLQDNTIRGGEGGRGVDGVAGNNGPNGNPGAGGSVFRVTTSCPAATVAGGTRGAAATSNGLCPVPGGTSTVDTRGGAGATSVCPSPGTPNNGGDAGAGDAAGSGGAGGGYATGSSSGGGATCSVDTSIEYEPNAGTSGSAGGDGAGGAAGGSPVGAVSGTMWRGPEGDDGGNGGAGSGGGGGGAAGGVAAGSTSYVGASGGGGGAGGCAAGGGSGGGAGGGSFAVKIVFTGAGPSSTAAMPTVRNNVLRRGRGGTGGTGGNGGTGGQGGAGGAGGPSSGSQTYAFCMLDGGDGGAGGRGGHGGGGSGGPGGASFDIFVWNSNGNDPGYNTNTFVRGASAETGGAGGQGGVAVLPVSNGEKGASGLFGPLYTVP